MAHAWRHGILLIAHRDLGILATNMATEPIAAMSDNPFYQQSSLSTQELNVKFGEQFNRQKLKSFVYPHWLGARNWLILSRIVIRRWLITAQCNQLSIIIINKFQILQKEQCHKLKHDGLNKRWAYKKSLLTSLQS